MNEQLIVGGLTNSSEDDDLAIHAFDGSMAALDAFKPEPSDAVAANGAPADRPAVSLATLALAGIVCDANDVVAIGLGLCQAFIGTQLRRRLRVSSKLSETTLPIDLESIGIDATGRVTVSIGALDDEAATVHAIARVLSDLLPSDSRSFLKTKIISKALASPSQFATIDQLSQALNAVSRPDRKDLVKAIYDLWQREAPKTRTAASLALTAPTAESVPAKPIEPPVTLPEPEATDEDSTGAAQRARYRRLALAAAVIVASLSTIGIGAWFVSTRSGTSTASTEAIEPATPVPTGSTTAPTDTSTSGRTSAVPKPATAKSATASLPALRLKGLPTREPPAANSTPMVAASIDISARPLDAADDPRQTGKADVAARTSLSTPSAAARSDDLADPAAIESDEPRIYGQDDREVTPPRPVLHRLLAGLRPSSPNVRLDALTIAVVVNADGSVDSVRGLVAPENISEVLLLTEALSAVKSWRFNPATRDGAPVKYRQIVPMRNVTGATP